MTKDERRTTNSVDSSSVFRLSSKPADRDRQSTASWVILQDRHCGIAPGRTGDAAAWMRAAAAHIQVAYRRAVVGPLRRWAEEEQLLERQFAVEDMPCCQSNH